MLGKFQGELGNTFQTIIRQTEEKIAVLEKDIQDKRLLTNKVVIQIKAIFLEALATMMS